MFEVKLPWWHQVMRPFFALANWARDQRARRAYETVGYLIFPASAGYSSVTIACQGNGFGRRRIVFIGGFGRWNGAVFRTKWRYYEFYRPSYTDNEFNAIWRIARLEYAQAWLSGDSDLSDVLIPTLPPPDWEGWQESAPTTQRSATRRTKAR